MKHGIRKYRIVSESHNIRQLRSGVFDSVKFAKEISFCRRLKKESLRETGAQIGVSAATLSRIERGEKPDIDTFMRICKWLGAEKFDVSRYYKIVLPDEAIEILKASKNKTGI